LPWSDARQLQGVQIFSDVGRSFTAEIAKDAERHLLLIRSCDQNVFGPLGYFYFSAAWLYVPLSARATLLEIVHTGFLRMLLK
jgi:hypothetical protein